MSNNSVYFLKDTYIVDFRDVVQEVKLVIRTSKMEKLNILEVRWELY